MSSLRIPPIDNPKNMISKIGFLFIKKQFGKVTTVAKVIYARAPKIMLLVRKMFDIEDRMSIGKEITLLIQTYVATLNGCSFCVDISSFKAQQSETLRKKLKNVYHYDESDNFNAAEKAVLDYTKDVTTHVSVKEETYNKLKIHFSDQQIIELTYAIAAENFLNRLTKPLGIASDNLCEIA